MASRQDPGYAELDSVRDAVALVVATVHGDDDLVETALRHALEGTDHTQLAFSLAQVSNGLVHLISEHTDQSPIDLMRAYALSVGVVVDGLTDGPPEGPA